MNQRFSEAFNEQFENKVDDSLVYFLVCGGYLAPQRLRPALELAESV